MPTTKESKNSKWVYIGPAYKNGILIPGQNGDKMIKPKSWADNQIEAMLKKYPQATQYFTKN